MRRGLKEGFFLLLLRARARVGLTTLLTWNRGNRGPREDSRHDGVGADEPFLNHRESRRRRGGAKRGNECGKATTTTTGKIARVAEPLGKKLTSPSLSLSLAFSCAALRSRHKHYYRPCILALEHLGNHERGQSNVHANDHAISGK